MGPDETMKRRKYAPKEFPREISQMAAEDAALRALSRETRALDHFGGLDGGFVLWDRSTGKNLGAETPRAFLARALRIAVSLAWRRNYPPFQEEPGFSHRWDKRPGKPDRLRVKGRKRPPAHVTMSEARERAARYLAAVLRSAGVKRNLAAAVDKLLSEIIPGDLDASYFRRLTSKTPKK